MVSVCLLLKVQGRRRGIRFERVTPIFSFYQVSLSNVVMELRKLCGHPYLLDGVEPNVRNQNEANRWVLDSLARFTSLKC